MLLQLPLTVGEEAKHLATEIVAVPGDGLVIDGRRFAASDISHVSRSKRASWVSVLGLFVLIALWIAAAQTGDQANPIGIGLIVLGFLFLGWSATWSHHYVNIHLANGHTVSWSTRSRLGARRKLAEPRVAIAS
jgi:hypothetical protein